MFAVDGCIDEFDNNWMNISSNKNNQVPVCSELHFKTDALFRILIFHQ